jgi:hypothetical protein
MKTAHEVFSGLRARARTGILIEGAACLAAVLLGFVLLSYLIDRWLELEVAFRAILLLGLVALAARVATRRLRGPLAVELDDAELTLAIERTDPGIAQSLISAVEFDRALEHGRARGQSEVLMRSVVDAAERRFAQLDFVRALDGRRVLRFGLGLGAAVAALMTFLALVPDAGLWARRNLLLAAEEWPRRTTLAFEGVPADGVLRIAEREDLTLRVRAAGEIPDQLELVARFAGGDRALRTMDRTGEDRFAATLAALLEDVELQARGGDGETGTLAVRIVPRPRITDLQVRIFPPAYVDAEPSTSSDFGGELEVARGGAVELSARSSKPLRQAALVLGEGRRFAAGLGDGGLTIAVRIEPEASGSLRIDATDTDDLGPVNPPQLLIRVVEDRVPELDFESRGVGSLITANARIPGLLRLRDDFGLATAVALGRTMDAEPPDGAEPAPEPDFAPAAVTWAGPLQVGATEQDLELVFDLEPLMVDADPDSPRNPVHPGQLLSLRFDATDQRAPEAQTGSTDVRTFRVVTREKLLQELRRRQEEQRRELERVLTKVVEARAELAEVLSPTADRPEAPRAALRVQTLSRQQSALGRTVQGVAERYGVVLEELGNNRLFEPNVVRGIEARIVSPLIALALDRFPESATRTALFAERGTEDTRSSAVEVYDELIAVLERVIEQMEKSESLSELVETLRIVIRTEEELARELEKLRDDEGAGIFGDPTRRDPPAKDREKK